MWIEVCSTLNLRISLGRMLGICVMLACLHACMLACLHACLGGSSDAARVRARAREMKGPRWPRYWRKRGRIEIARRLTKIENSKRSIISRTRVATDCAGASTPNHVPRIDEYRAVSPCIPRRRPHPISANIEVVLADANISYAPTVRHAPYARR